MQNFRLIFLHFLLGLSMLSIAKTLNESKISSKAQLIFADSLFEIGKYTEAFEVYEKLLKEDHRYTPKMLLRMAYIKEGLDDYTQALYYLNLYYRYQADDQVLAKMAEIAEKKKLIGYEFTDYDFLLALFQRYYLYIIFSLFSLSFLFMLGMIIRWKKQQKFLPLAVANFVLLAVSFYLVNYVKHAETAIVKEDYVYAMSAPSAGADVMKIFKKGDRVTIVGKHDIWKEIASESERGFIRQHHLLLIE